MVTKNPLAALRFSRRTTLQIALAAAIAGKMAGAPSDATAQDATIPPWNWSGNAGHTGEFPGPGLNLDQPLGELWRLPLDEFVSDSDGFGLPYPGYWNGVLYTFNGDSLWARRLQDGAFLWAKTPADLAVPVVETPSAAASPEVSAEAPFFYGVLAIDNGLILAPMSNDARDEVRGLWALDAETGELRWDLGSEPTSLPTVVEQVAYFRETGGVSAYDLTDPPTLRWNWTLDTGAVSSVRGVFNAHAYVVRYPSSFHALSTTDGSELWRLTETDLGGTIWIIYGITTVGIALLCESPDSGELFFVLVSHDGEIAWKRPNSGWDDSWWITEQTIIHGVGGYQFAVETLHPENGAFNWRFETPFEVRNSLLWYANNFGLLCDGRAYGGIPDNDWTGSLMVIIDPVAISVFAARGLSLRPVFIADGIMLAYDNDTDEIAAVGSVPGSLRVSGRASVTKDTTLRSTPNDAAIERAQVATDTLVEITGESETTNGVEWVPVTLPDTGKSGYLPVDALNGQDGSIRFESVNLSELAPFGGLTIYPRVSPRTRAKLTEQVELRGAPSETSASKGTFEAGTAVTVTSSPSIGTTGDLEWCAITVDATGESGWVPTTVLSLLPPA